MGFCNMRTSKKSKAISEQDLQNVVIIGIHTKLCLTHSEKKIYKNVSFMFFKMLYLNEKHLYKFVMTKHGLNIMILIHFYTKPIYCNMCILLYKLFLQGYVEHWLLRFKSELEHLTRLLETWILLT